MRLGASRTGRVGFTLLEMLLATAIAVLLLGALYVAFDLQLRHVEAARDVVEQTTLARALMSRIATDIGPGLGTPDPSRYRQGQQSGSGGTGGSTSGAATSTATGGAATSGTTTSGTTDTSSSTGTGAATTSTLTTSGAILFAVQGDATMLSIFVSRVPRDAGGNLTGPDAQSPSSDLRRITYWLAGGPDAPLGLAREEITLVTSEEAFNFQPPELSDPTSRSLIAPEVRGLSFSYFDGTAWVDTWDGSAVGSDGMTPLGPPVAIAVTLQLARPNGGPEDVKTYRHVVSIPTANGLPKPTDTTGTTSGTTTASTP